MTKDAAVALVAMLEVGLHSPGVCPVCLIFVAFALDEGDERKVAGQITEVAPLLWDEGLGDVVRVALEEAAKRPGDEAAEGLRELDARGAASWVFRAVVRRLAAAAVARDADALVSSDRTFATVPRLRHVAPLTPNSTDFSRHSSSGADSCTGQSSQPTGSPWPERSV